MADREHPVPIERREQWLTEDPTALTRSEVSAAETRFRRELDAALKNVETELAALKELGKQQFEQVGRSFVMLERTRLEHKADTEKNVTNAFSAQQLAIDKSEQAVKEQLAQLRDMVSTLAETNISRLTAVENDLRRGLEQSQMAVGVRIQGLVDVAAKIDNRLTGIEQQKVGAKDNTALIGGGVAVLLMVLAMMGWIASHNNPTYAVPAVTAVPAVPAQTK
jgi:hypothetical protein